MNTRMLLSLMIISVFFSSAAIAGEWKGFDEGFREAKSRKCPVFVDFSTDWCGWCKKMDKDVFSRPDVARRLSAECVTVRLDAESASPLTYKGRKMTSRQFTGLMGVQGFPTLIVFDAEGNTLSELIGYAEARTFLQFLDYVKQKKYSSMSFETYLGQSGK